MEWTCGNKFGCSSQQETCWLSFTAKKSHIELHAHVNLKGNEPIAFDLVKEKPNRVNIWQPCIV